MRERIIDVAKALFEEKGIEGMSMRAIASRVGIPTIIHSPSGMPSDVSFA